MKAQGLQVSRPRLVRNRDESAINGRPHAARNPDYYELELETIPGFERKTQDLEGRSSYPNIVACESGSCSKSLASEEEEEEEDISKADQESFHIPICNGNIDLEGYFETLRQQMDLIEDNCIMQQNLIRELLNLNAAENPEARTKDIAQPYHEGLVPLPFHRKPKVEGLARQIYDLAHINIFANHKSRKCTTSIKRAFKGRGNESDLEDSLLEMRAHHGGSRDDNVEEFGGLNGVANRSLVSIGDATINSVISRWDESKSSPPLVGAQFPLDDLTVRMQTATTHRFLAAEHGIQEIRRRDLQDVLSCRQSATALPMDSLGRILPGRDPKLSGRGHQAQLDLSERISTWQLGLSQYGSTSLLRTPPIETANSEQYILVPRQSDPHEQQPIGEG